MKTIRPAITESTVRGFGIAAMLAKTTDKYFPDNKYIPGHTTIASLRLQYKLMVAAANKRKAKAAKQAAGMK